MGRKVELAFAVLFAICFVNWLNFDLPVVLGWATPSSSWYAHQVDPVYLSVPSWLRAVKGFALIFGPLYLATAYGFFRRRSWVPYLVLPLAGMLVTSVGIFLIADATGEVPPSNLAVFYLSNVPYIVLPVLAATWAIAQLRKSSERRARTGAAA